MGVAIGRSIFFTLWLSVITVFFSVVALVVIPLPPHWRYAVIVNWAKLVIGGLRLLCGVNYRVVGESNIPPTPCVYLSRHESAWETIALLFILRRASFVLKRSLLFIPFFGWGLWQMSPIPIHRGKRVAAVKQLVGIGRQRLQSGFSVVIFPEGTRLLPCQEKQYFGGGALLAKTAGVAVVPVALNSGHCWGRNQFVKQAGTITVQFGNAISTAELSVDEINSQAKTWINQTRQHLQPTPPKK